MKWAMSCEASFTYNNPNVCQEIQTERDMTEFYSQFMQNFVYDWSFMQEMSSHYKTGKKLPRSVFKEVMQTQKFVDSFNIMDNLLLASKELEINLLDDSSSLESTVKMADKEIFGDSVGLIPNIFYEKNSPVFPFAGNGEKRYL